MRRFLRYGTGYDSPLWPVLLLLLIVLIPSAGVVWMMRAAMDNERLAVRQRLADVYRAQLEFAKRRIDGQWQQLGARLDEAAHAHSPAQAFSQLVSSGNVDSAVITDEHGEPAYPASRGNVAETDQLSTDPAWRRAEQLEFAGNAPRDAAIAYRELAANSSAAEVKARAEQAEARCLLRAGDKDAATAVLRTLRTRESATDSQGRSLGPDAELRLLELLDADSTEWQSVATSLVTRLRDYSGRSLPADQRRFLMHELIRLKPDVSFNTLAAEDLAADFISATRDATETQQRTSDVRATPIKDVWQLQSASGRVIALWRTESLRTRVKSALAEQPFPDGVVVEAQGPAEATGRENELLAVSLAPRISGWRLSLSPANNESFDVAANSRVAYFLWTAVVLVAITVTLALLVANMLRRQRRLTQLKNDLVATVSHELKTPLASIRLLVDTLLEADGSANSPAGDREKTRQYLEMIAQENTRLSRLIDNFLTFSRMERGKQRFDFQPTDAAMVVDQARACVIDRFHGPQAELQSNVERPLPLVADFNALVTVVLNLLDNAWKYTDEPKRVSITARRQGKQIAIAVSDNGIGLPARAVPRVFDRFYQVDQRLSRSHSGCGLGLSIVKYIVDAHGGRVVVESRLGEGSKFTVLLPADETIEAQRHAPADRSETCTSPLNSQ
jgi:signal transduction histidine kinase